MQLVRPPVVSVSVLWSTLRPCPAVAWPVQKTWKLPQSSSILTEKKEEQHVNNTTNNTNKRKQAVQLTAAGRLWNILLDMRISGYGLESCWKNVVCKKLTYSWYRSMGYSCSILMGLGAYGQNLMKLTNANKCLHYQPLICTLAIVWYSGPMRSMP